jgi:hypothetical protein
MGTKNLSSILLKPTTTTMVILGIFVNLGTILSPYFPAIGKWQVWIFLSFAILFWIIVFVRKKIENRRLASLDLPLTFVNTWPSPNYKTIITDPFIQGNIEKLKELESVSLALLIGDRLDTGAWSRTLSWRFYKAQKKLSPVGSLTSTYFALQALLPYGYLKMSQVKELLAPNLAKILASDGTVIYYTQLTAVGSSEVIHENLRHSSAFLLTRSLLGASPINADTILYSRIIKELSSRLSMEETKYTDMLGTAFGTSALIAGINWIQRSKLDAAKTAIEVISLFAESEYLWQPGFVDWGREPGAAAASGTAAQWVSVWHLVSLISWRALSVKIQLQISKMILTLIDGNLIHRHSESSLFPHSFAINECHQPIGDSLLATGIALYAVNTIAAVTQDASLRCKAEELSHQLLSKLINSGYEYTIKGSLEAPYEGYLAWAAILFGLRLILHPNGTFIEGSDMLSNAEIIINGAVKKESTMNNDIITAKKKIDILLRDTEIKVYPNGLYQDF